MVSSAVFAHQLGSQQLTDRLTSPDLRPMVLGSPSCRPAIPRLRRRPCVQIQAYIRTEAGSREARRASLSSSCEPGTAQCLTRSARAWTIPVHSCTTGSNIHHTRAAVHWHPLHDVLPDETESLTRGRQATVARKSAESGVYSAHRRRKPWPRPRSSTSSFQCSYSHEGYDLLTRSDSPLTSRLSCNRPTGRQR